MNLELTSHQRKILEKLRQETDYEDHHKGGTENYIPKGQLGVRAGLKSLSALVDLGLAKTGTCRFSREIGHRITDHGRDLLKRPMPKARTTEPKKIASVQARIGRLKGPFES